MSAALLPRIILFWHVCMCGQNCVRRSEDKILPLLCRLYILLRVREYYFVYDEISVSSRAKVRLKKMALTFRRRVFIFIFTIIRCVDGGQCQTQSKYCKDILVLVLAQRNYFKCVNSRKTVEQVFCIEFQCTHFIEACQEQAKNLP